MTTKTKNETFLGALIKDTKRYVYPAIAQKKVEYICPDCNKDLILCKGLKVPPYFRHNVDSQCTYYSKPTESQIHKDAKMLLKKLLDDKVPIRIKRHLSCCDENNGEFDIPELKPGYSIVLEHRFDYNGLKIADVAYINDKTKKIICIFEIFNTSRTRETSRSGLWFELDARNLIEKVKNSSNIKSLVELECARLECIKCCGPKLEKEKRELEEQNKRNIEEQNRKFYYKSLVKTFIEAQKLKYISRLMKCCDKKRVIIPNYLNEFKVDIDHVLVIDGVKKMVDVAYFDNNNNLLCSIDISDDTKSDRYNINDIPEPFFIINSLVLDKFISDPTIEIICLRSYYNKCNECIAELKIKKDNEMKQHIIKLMQNNSFVIRHCCCQKTPINMPCGISDSNIEIKTNQLVKGNTVDFVYVDKNSNKKWYINIYRTDSLNCYKINGIPDPCYLVNLMLDNYQKIIGGYCIIHKEKCQNCEEEDEMLQDEYKKSQLEKRSWKGNAVEANRIRRIIGRKHGIVDTFVVILKKSNTIILSAAHNCCNNHFESSVRNIIQNDNITIENYNVVCKSQETGNKIIFKIIENKANRKNEHTFTVNNYAYNNNNHVLRLNVTQSDPEKCEHCLSSTVSTA